MISIIVPKALTGSISLTINILMRFIFFITLITHLKNTIMNSKTIITIILVAFFSLDSYGVPYPEKINWYSSPSSFVHTLYEGVLGRYPENSKVVKDWATNITSDHSSRIKVFWMFVNSKEYQASSWAKQKREYSVYYKWVGQERSLKQYYISKTGSDVHVSGLYTFGVAMALNLYYSKFDPKSDRYNKNTVKILNDRMKAIELLNVPLN